MSNFNVVVDRRERDAVTIRVGVEANGGPFGFGPPAVHVRNGTTVRWKWTGDGGQHSVVHRAGGFESELHSEAGVHFEHTFRAQGIYKYHCGPHESKAMKGAVVVGTDYPTTASGEVRPRRITLRGTVEGGVTEQDRVGRIEVPVGRAEGSGPIDLRYTTAQWVGPGGVARLAAGDDATDSTFATLSRRDDDGSFPVLNADDVATVVLDATAISDDGLAPGSSVSLTLVTPSKSATKVRLTVPDTVSSSDVVALD